MMYWMRCFCRRKTGEQEEQGKDSDGDDCNKVLNRAIRE